MSEEKWLTLLFKFRWQIAILLVGASLLGLGIFFTKGKLNTSNGVEVIEAGDDQKDQEEIIVEVSGAVENPGVYKLSPNARTEDALIAAGGVSADADRDWMDRTINRAAKVTDGQKIYIAQKGETVQGVSTTTDQASTAQKATSALNINTATQNQLESLWGIGPVTAQNIIEQRPYSSVEELLTKKIIKSNVYEKNKDLLTVY